MKTKTFFFCFLRKLEELQAQTAVHLPVCKDAYSLSDAGTRLCERDGFGRMKMEEMISQLLRKIGLRGTLRGFHYLSKAILLVLEDASYLLHLTKRLYPDVALACNATQMRVERSMRTAIEVIWNQGDVAALEGKALCGPIHRYSGRVSAFHDLTII